MRTMTQSQEIEVRQRARALFQDESWPEVKQVKLGVSISGELSCERRWKEKKEEPGFLMHHCS